MGSMEKQGLYEDLSSIIELARKSAYQTVDRILVLRNWLLGKRITEESMSGTHAERYGENIISELARQLTDQFGKGFDKRSLYRYVKFYQTYPEIVETASPLSLEDRSEEIVGAASPLSRHLQNQYGFTHPILSWSHYTLLLQVADTMLVAQVLPLHRIMMPMLLMRQLLQ